MDIPALLPDGLLITVHPTGGLGERYLALKHGQDPFVIDPVSERFYRPSPPPPITSTQPAKREAEAQRIWRSRRAKCSTLRGEQR